MKKIGLLLAFLFPLLAFCQDLPQASPVSKTEQRVGLTDVSVRYSRPSVRGRKIWGELVPYKALWRAGANAATIIFFSDDVLLNGNKVPEGSYSLYFIPDEKEWTVILNKNINLWGTEGYKQSEDFLRFQVQADANSTMFVETLLFAFDNIRIDGAELIMLWDRMKLSLKIEVDTDTKAIANIKRAVAEADNIYKLYNTSATYLLDANKEPLKALDWAKKSVEMQEKFWNLHTLARAYAANNMFKEAISMAQKSLKLSQEAKNETFIKLNEKSIEDWKKKKMK
ncbi:MAG: DUF2911 domain-containing protein [Thermonemataceae bacterium]|nr:DUF2911 domain-containing protein [Thermonemataceae bacterium]